MAELENQLKATEATPDSDACLEWHTKIMTQLFAVYFRILKKGTTVDDALWIRIANIQDGSTGPLARPFARITHFFACAALLASLCLFCFRAPLRLFVCSLTYSRAGGKVN